MSKPANSFSACLLALTSSFVTLSFQKTSGVARLEWARVQRFQKGLPRPPYRIRLQCKQAILIFWQFLGRLNIITWHNVVFTFKLVFLLLFFSFFQYCFCFSSAHLDILFSAASVWYVVAIKLRQKALIRWIQLIYILQTIMKGSVQQLWFMVFMLYINMKWSSSLERQLLVPLPSECVKWDVKLLRHSLDPNA